MVYSEDSDILIHLNRYYPRKDYPREWQLFEDLLNNENMKISRHVYKEITDGDDYVSNWIKGFKNAIYDDTEEIQEIVSRIVNKYDFVLDPTSTKNFADPFVLAVAEHLGGIVVTDEGNGHLNPNLVGNFSLMQQSPNKVKLNLICHEEGIPCLSLYQFLARCSKGYNSE